jgi:hypothetical protein
MPEQIRANWQEYFQLLGVENPEQEALIKDRLLDWPNYGAYMDFVLETMKQGASAGKESEEEDLAEEGEPVELVESDPNYLLEQFQLAAEIVVGEDQVDLGENPEKIQVFFAKSLPHQFRYIKKPTLTRRKRAVIPTGDLISPETTRKLKKGGQRAANFLNKLGFGKKKNNSSSTPAEPAPEESAMPEPKLSQTDEDTEIKVIYEPTREDEITYEWQLEKLELSARLHDIPPNEPDTRQDLHFQLDQVTTKLTGARALKSELMVLKRNKELKERPIYFAKNSSHVTSAKDMPKDGVANILVTNFDLAYGFKRYVPKKDWADLIGSLPPSYIETCTLGLGGLGRYLNKDAPLRRWIWFADEDGNEYSVATLPVIKFRNSWLAAGGTLSKIYAAKEQDIGAAVAAKLLEVDLGDIEEVYYPIVVHINPDNRDYLNWIERQPTRNFPFRIILGPQELRGQRVSKRTLRGEKMRKEMLWLVEDYAERHGINIHAVMNLNFVARGVRNLCTIELINLSQSKDLEKETDSFRFSFGATTIKKNKKDLKHEVLLKGEKMPRMQGDYLDRIITTVSGTREGHSETLHIDPKVMYDFGLRYLISDLEKIHANSAEIR